MKISRNKSKISTVTLVLVLSIVATLITCLPVVYAEDRETLAFVSLVPNPVGVGQSVSVTVGLQPIPPTFVDVFHNFTVTITRPDLTTETRGPLTSSAIGMQYFTYIPNRVGTFKFQLTYPGETFVTYLGDITYLPSESPITELIVQQNPIPEWPAAELPTDYWKRPISAENREWASIAGNWLMRAYNYTYHAWDASSGFNPYSTAPRSPHIVWTKEIQLGGLIGGEYGSSSYYSGLSYEPKMTPPIILNGRLYYNTHQSDFGMPGVMPGFVCVDLRTGEELWRKTEDHLDVAQLYNFVSGNQMGGLPYLWSFGWTEWKMFDAFTGDWILTFENSQMPAGSWGAPVIRFGNDGRMFSYHIDSNNGWLAMWNSTKAFQTNGLITESAPGIYMWRPRQGTYDWTAGLEWNVTITPFISFFAPIEAISDGVIVAQQFDPGSPVGSIHIGYDMNTGDELWYVTRTEVDSYNRAYGEGIYAVQDTMKGTWNAYDIQTGAHLWESEPMGYPWGFYGAHTPIIAYGKLYGTAYDGYVHAYDIGTGDEVWNFSSGNAGLETPYGTYPMYYGPIIADGVLFEGTGEHSPTQPLIRGERLFAVDAETGLELWNITGLHAIQAIADGYLVGYNGYDNQLYAFGKGPTATTVTVSQKVITKGDTVLIEGTITDQSPGQPGTPCVSKDSMSVWMEYLHMQKPQPMITEGVPVQLFAMSSNGSVISIGTVTSDTGGFRYEWTPDEEDLYAITASFAGDEAYGSSWAATGLSVGPTPPVAPEPEPAPAPAYTTVDLAIMAAVVVVAVLVLYDIISVRKLRK